MVRPLAHTPGWLSRPSPGFDLFQPNSTTSKTEAQHIEGRRRCIAHRGNEVFVAVGNELRWSNVGLLRDAGADAADNGQSHGHERAYRVLKVPGYRDITELSVSPDGTWIAILTSHTCHVAILPTPSHLHANDFSPLRLKSYQIGPSAHVLEQSPLVRSLWHPLAPSDNVLVTVTQDACVRMWELNSDNRATFSEPSLAVDLKKLNNAASSQADFSASKYGTNKGFSADDVQMETAAACFGGQGSEDEHGWSGMTLWVAMTEGDVYALCPFLPSKWRAPASLLPSLSTSVVASARATAHDPECSESEKRTSDQQCRWLADIDDQDPTSQYDEAGAVYAEIYNRPPRPGPVPKLQGPFALAPEPNFGEITDIHVIAPKLDEEALFGDDDDSEATAEGLSAGVICLAASTQQVHICLDLEGVGAEWLPAKRSRGYTYDDEEEKELIVLETVDLARSDEPAECWPTFTKSPISKHEFFVSLPEGVSSLAISPWATSLESELSSEITEGIGFRLKQLLDNAKTTVDEPISMFADPNEQPNTAIALIDPSLGYFLLTTASDEPHAAILDIPDVQDPFAPDELDHQVVAPAIEPREPYQAAHVFFEASQLPSFITNARKRAASKSVDPDARLKFTPEVLELMAEAHRVLSNETHRLGLAAADIFRRCERMRSELREQVRKVQEMSQKVDAVTGEEYGQNGDDSEERMGREKTAAAIEETRAKNTRLNERVESLRRRMLKLGDGQLSNKEAQFLEEVDKTNTAIGQGSGDDKDAPVGPDQILHMDNSRSSSLRRSTGPPKTEKMAGSLSTRFEQAEELCKSLARQAAEVSQHQVEGAERSQQAQSGDRYRRQALAQVMNLLEREMALMDAVSERLRRLGGLE
ncbi:hypothetical protein MBLNU230_g6950t1 [Neophaeotheca triangularis]